MKKFKIVDKKTFILSVFFILTLIGGLYFSILKIVEFKRSSMISQRNSQQDISQEKIVQEKNKETASNLEAQNYAVQQEQEAISQTYNNQQYEYIVNFPNNWYLNSDSSETKLENISIVGKTVASGGQTFWSNYKNIDDFSPEQKPEDFHLLGLAIYESAEMSADDLANMLGFDAESILKRDAFDGKAISGIEFVATGEDEKNPLVMIIFQKDQRFYVFNLGFISGDAQAVETMENIAKTLVLK
jgi:hypothetical protein